jgi:ATP-dependent Clp protease ATP-binding subunit ClpA
MEPREQYDHRLTERARMVLHLAQTEAQRQQKPLIETEHILLALLAEREGIAGKTLENLGKNPQELRETIARLQASTSEANPPQTQTPATSSSPTPEDVPPSGKLNLSPEAEDTILLAIDEARRLNHYHIGTEHFLLALAQQPQSLAFRALQAHSIDISKVRIASVQTLSQGLSGSGLNPQSSQNPGAGNRDRFNKFTERARKVLSLAQEEAQRFQHNYIGTEHLLLGLVREGQGVAAQALNNMNVSLDKIRAAVEFIIGSGDRIVLGEIGLTPRAKKVIELAVDESRRLNHHYIGTEHILLGLVREGQGIAAGVLESLGVKLQALREMILTVLGIEGSSNATEDSLPDELPIYQTEDTNNYVTQQTVQAVRSAESERARLKHPTLGSEHILLGLLSVKQSLPEMVLRQSGITLPALYAAIEQLQEREELPYPWRPAYTPLVKALEGVSGQEAMRMRSSTISPEHLLLAVLHFPESNAAKILQLVGTDSATIRNKLLELLQE